MDIEKLISNLTLEEKAMLCSGENKWRTQSIERLGIPSKNMFDGPSGIRKPLDENQFGINELCCEATCYPTGSAMASTWNRDVMTRLGKALAVEAKAGNVNLLLGPGINMKRSPLGGRNFEYYSEDPFLTGELAAAYVIALQNEGVGACLKHFVCNNSEYERMSMSSEVDERALREIYLSAFKRVIDKVQPWAIMAAYNKVNGVHATENKQLLNDILRDEWKYNQLIISDWGAVDDRVKGLAVSLDIEMPGPAYGNDKKIVQAVLSGKLKEDILNQTVRRVLKFVKKSFTNTSESIDFESHNDLAREIANESITLLKNNNNILPLEVESEEKVAIIGQLAMTPRFQGGGSSRVQAKQIEKPLDHIKRIISNCDARFKFANGYHFESEEVDSDLISEAVVISKEADKVIVFLGLDDLIESEGYDRLDMELPINQIALLEEVTKVNKNIVVLLHTGSAVTMRQWIDKVQGVVQVWLSGQAAGAAIVDILFGIVNPSGKLSETFPLRLEHNPTYFNYPGENGKVRYSESIFVGYRYYDKKMLSVQFPFGHGLSYTTFEYSEMKVNADCVKDNEGVEVAVAIKNTGEIYGAEVVQLYIRDNESRLIRPEQELKGFEKVFLNPGEKQTLHFKLKQEDFSYFDPERGGWIVETGEFTIMLGSSSRDIRTEKTVNMISTHEEVVRLSHESLVKEWLNSEKGKKLFWSTLDKYNLKERVKSALEGENRDMVLGMPVKKVFYFEPKLANQIDEIVSAMIVV